MQRSTWRSVRVSRSRSFTRVVRGTTGPWSGSNPRPPWTSGSPRSHTIACDTMVCERGEPEVHGGRGLEPLHGPVVPRTTRVKDLDRDTRTDLQVDRCIHAPHPAFAEHLLDRVAAKALTDQ